MLQEQKARRLKELSNKVGAYFRKVDVVCYKARSQVQNYRKFSYVSVVGGRSTTEAS